MTEIGFVNLYGKMLFYYLPLGIFKKKGSLWVYSEYDGDEIERASVSMSEKTLADYVKKMNTAAANQEKGIKTSPEMMQNVKLSQIAAVHNMVEFTQKALELLSGK